MKENNICLYFHINPVKKEIFYVGIGDEKRPYSKHHRSKFWHNTVNKYGYSILIIKENISWEEACKLERHFIMVYGRRDLGLGKLVNLTDGGDGAMGQIVSDETRKKMSIGIKNNLPSTSWKKGQISWNKGLNHSEETRKKIGKSLKGSIPWNKGKTGIYSDETILKMSIAQKGINNGFKKGNKFGKHK